MTDPTHPTPATPAAPAEPATLARRLGLADAVVIGLGAMIGAGVYSAVAPAATAASSGLLLGLVLAAIVAYCNATSSARLAAMYPHSGGTYVYGTRRLGPFWGYAAGWSFVVGKTASCAAMALTFAAYAVPHQSRVVAALAVAALCALSVSGVRRAALLNRVIVIVSLVVLAGVVCACVFGGHADAANLRPFPHASVHAVLQAGGLLFFAFAGYARIATLGEEVRDPQRTIPRAVTIALTITIVVYAAVFVCALVAVGPAPLATSTAPLRTAVEAGSWTWFAPVVRVGAAVAALGSLLALILGVSRTTFAMARDRYLPAPLALVRREAPVAAEVAVCAVVVVLVLAVDLRGAIGFSSFGVLLYYGVANASALTLSGRRWSAALGLVGCVVLAANLPVRSVLVGVGVAVVGAVAYLVTSRRSRGGPAPASR